jgi:hypothetical protein
MEDVVIDALCAGARPVHHAASTAKHFFECKYKLPGRDASFRACHNSYHL